MWHPGACRLGPKGVLLLRPGRPRRVMLKGLGSARAGGPAVREFEHSDVASVPSASLPGTFCRKSLHCPAKLGRVCASRRSAGSVRVSGAWSQHRAQLGGR